MIDATAANPVTNMNELSTAVSELLDSIDRNNEMLDKKIRHVARQMGVIVILMTQRLGISDVEWDVARAKAESLFLKMQEEAGEIVPPEPAK